jgi:hypothetical protein
MQRSLKANHCQGGEDRAHSIPVSRNLFEFSWEEEPTGQFLRMVSSILLDSSVFLRTAASLQIFWYCYAYAVSSSSAAPGCCTSTQCRSPSGGCHSSGSRISVCQFSMRSNSLQVSLAFSVPLTVCSTPGISCRSDLPSGRSPGGHKRRVWGPLLPGFGR